MEARYDPRTGELMVRARLRNAIARRTPDGTASILLDARQTLGYIEREGRTWRLDIEAITFRVVPVDGGELGGDERTTYLFQL